MSVTSGHAIRALKSATTNRLAVRTFASSTSSAQVNVETFTREKKSTTLQGESQEDAWKRNMKEAREWRRRKDHQRSNISVYIPEGSTPAPQGRPTLSPREATLSTLLAAGAALGHAANITSHAYTPYIYGKRAGLSIIDLDHTLPILRRTAALVRDVVKADGMVLIVGTRPGHQKMIKMAKARLEDNGYAAGHWMPGLLTNAEALFGLKPILDKSYKPDLVIFLNPSETTPAIRECTSRHIPTIGIVDSDTDPRLVTYAIPANMESMRTSEIIVSTLTIAGQEGRRLRLKEAERKAANARANRGHREGR